MPNSPSESDRTLPDSNPETPPQKPVDGEDIKEEAYDAELEVEEEEEEEEDASTGPQPPRPKSRDFVSRLEKLKTEALLQRMKNGPVSLRVHDVIIQGNTKTKEHVIEAETAPLMDARTIQELLQVSSLVNLRLQSLGIFDSVKITLDSGPLELSGTANVIIDVTEAGNPLTGEIGAYTKPEARSSTVEGSLKYKNLFGYGDTWDGSLSYGYDHSAEVSAGVYMPRFKGLVTPLTARVYLLSQDWLKFSSYKERSLGLSLGLFSSKHHDFSYALGWRTLTDPSQMSSSTIRRQLGHSLFSSLKHTFKVDQRDSYLRPTQGYAFVSTTQVGGLVPDSRALQFLRQEVDVRCAVPIGFYRAALNFGISGGLVIPWGNGFLSKPSSLPERFFLGGNISPVCALGGPASLWGFKTRGLGPNEQRRKKNMENGDSVDVDFIGGDAAVVAMADLSFDLPFRWFREKEIHGHAFACAGNMVKLTENAYQNFSIEKFLQSFRSSVGIGIVIPTSIFRMEINYCFITKKREHDRAKSGIWLTFSGAAS